MKHVNPLYNPQRSLVKALIPYLLVILSLSIFTSDALGQNCPAPLVDPQVNWKAYEAWCECQGGHVVSDYDGVRCEPKSSGYSYPGGVNPYQDAFDQFFGPIGEALGEAISNWLYGTKKDTAAELERQRQEQIRQWEEAQRLAREKEERRRQEFLRAKERILGEMRGPDTVTIQPKGIGDVGSEFEIRPVGGTLGGTRLEAINIVDLKPREITNSAPMTPLERAGCAEYLLQQADKALKDSIPPRQERAVYLSHQASALLDGTIDAPQVACPPLNLPDIEDVEGAPTPESQAQFEKITKQTVLYSKLYQRASQQMKDYSEIDQATKHAEEKVIEAKEKEEEAEEKVELLEVQKQENPEEVEESVLAAALAARRKARESRESNEKELADLQKKKEEMEKGMGQTGEMFEKAKSQPDKIDDLMEQLNAEESPEDEG